MFRSIMLLAALASVLALAPAATTGAALAANADNPQGNVDPKLDKGGDTGDSKVESLNAGQTDQNYRGPVTMQGAPQPAPGSVQPSPPARQ